MDADKSRTRIVISTCHSIHRLPSAFTKRFGVPAVMVVGEAQEGKSQADAYRNQQDYQSNHQRSVEISKEHPLRLAAGVQIGIGLVAKSETDSQESQAYQGPS